MLPENELGLNVLTGLLDENYQSLEKVEVFSKNSVFTKQGDNRKFPRACESIPNDPDTWCQNHLLLTNFK